MIIQGVLLMRIQKYLAHCTKYSRLAIEEKIRNSEIQVNGKLATIGQVLKDKDKIQLGDKTWLVDLKKPKEIQLWMVNKPLGVICSRKDDKGRQHIESLLPPISDGKWFMVGRLDVNTSGLLLFTNQGDFANQLMHPRFGVIRRYHVRVFGENHAAGAEKLTQGVILDGKKTRFLSCSHLPKPQKDSHNVWYEVEVSSGQYRMVRRLWESQGLKVSRLVRVSYGDILLPRDLRLGQCREIQADLVADIQKKLQKSDEK